MNSLVLAPLSMLAAAGTGKSLDPWVLVSDATVVVKLVILLLTVFSVVSWYIIAYKWYFIQRAQGQSTQFLDRFWGSKRLDAIYQASEELRWSPIGQIFKAGYIELSKLKGSKRPEDEEAGQTSLGDIENVQRALTRATMSEITTIERMIPFLATVGSTAPFVGLFGTVWGIMNSFGSIGAQGAANLAVVAPGIAEALIATAIGLVAAVPAVIAYNSFVSRIRVIRSDMDTFANDFLNIVKRHFFK